MSRTVEISTPENWKFSAIRTEISQIQKAIEEGLMTAKEARDGTISFKAYLDKKPNKEAFRIALQEYKQAGWKLVEASCKFEPYGYTLDVKLGYTIKKEEDEDA